MKVPNKVLHIVMKLANGTEQVSEDERSLVRQWALDGVAKRSNPNPAETAATTFGSLEKV